MAKLRLFNRLIIRSKNGKIKYDSGLLPSHSFVVAFLENMYGMFSGLAYDVEDTGNIVEEIARPFLAYERLVVDAAASNDIYGVVVGTGTAAEDNEDYALATQIADGTGAGQLQYGSHSIVAPAAAGSNVDLVITRTFANGSGASITVREIGIYCLSINTGSANKYFCILRDVLGTPQAVANGETLTVQYTLRTTV